MLDSSPWPCSEYQLAGLRGRAELVEDLFPLIRLALWPPDTVVFRPLSVFF